MGMTIAAVVVFAGLGLYCIIKRVEAARGFGLAMGARFAPGCMMMIGITLLLVAVGFIVLYQEGVLQSP